MQDWLWNLFWNSPEIIDNLAPEDGHYKIHTWPKPSDQSNRKIIFQLSACFIQGGKISKIAEQLNLSQNTVRHFIATNIAANNIEKINIQPREDVTYVLFLPVNEIHQIGLLYLNYELVSNGYKTIKFS